MPIIRVLAAGSNAHGQLANETFDDSHVFLPCVFSPDHISIPKYQLPGDKVHSIACGANHTLLLVELDYPNGQRHEPTRQLWGCGDGLKGQLGPSFSRSASQSRSPVFWRLDETIMAAASLDKEKYIISAIAAAWESTFIVLRPKHELLRHSQDIVIAMGNNDHGDLGIGLAPTELKYSHQPRRIALEEIVNADYPNILSGFHVRSIVAGLHHVIVMLQLFLRGGDEQIVIGWGSSRHEQLGSYPSPLSPRPKLDKQTRLRPFTLRPRILSVFQKVPGMHTTDPIVRCALGSHHSVFLHHSGRITGLGSNKKGQLAGLRDTPRIISDVRCTWNGTYLTLRSRDGEPSLDHPGWEIQVTGSGGKGQLGGGSVASSTLGLEAVKFPFTPDKRRLIDMACGSEHGLVLVERFNEGTSPGAEETQEVWAWGWNEHGNLGLGHTTDAHLPVVIWPLPGAGQVASRIYSIWAGCGTSWIVETS